MEFIVVGLIVFGAVYYVYKHLQKEIDGEGSCDCSSCPVSKKSGCHSAGKTGDDNLKQQ